MRAFAFRMTEREIWEPIPQDAWQLSVAADDQPADKKWPLAGRQLPEAERRIMGRCQLIVSEVHRPSIIRPDRRCTVFAQLGLDPPLARIGTVFVRC